MTISMPRILLVITLVLLVFALICTISTAGTILGAVWSTWLVAALISWCLDQLLGGFQIGAPRPPAPPVA